MTDEDRIKLAEAMGLDENPKGFEMQTLIEGEMQDYAYPGFEPFTDANDERAVFRHMMEQGFSVRQKYWRALRHIINERTEKLTPGGVEAAWPDAIMFLEDGDWARAALAVLCTGDSKCITKL